MLGEPITPLFCIAAFRSSEPAFARRCRLATNLPSAAAFGGTQDRPPPASGAEGAPGLENLSRYPMYERIGSCISCSRQVPPRRLSQSAPEIVSISSEALISAP